MAGKRPKVSSRSGSRSLQRKNRRFLMLALLLAALFSAGFAAVLFYVNKRQPVSSSSMAPPLAWPAFGRA